MYRMESVVVGVGLIYNFWWKEGRGGGCRLYLLWAARGLASLCRSAKYCVLLSG